MSKMMKTLRPALMSFLIMTGICGILYTGFITGASQLLFPSKSNGSIITVAGENGEETAYGSTLIAQEFTEPEYMIGRPLGVTNLSPVSSEQKDLVAERIEWFHNLDPENKAEIPMDLVTASGSGVDPHISIAAAEYQVARIAELRNMNEEEVQSIIDAHTVNRFLGIFGEPAVNVLEVNLELDGLLDSFE